MSLAAIARRLALLGGLLPALAQAQAADPAPPQPHHRGDHFQNQYLEFEPKGLGTLLQWQWQRLRDGLPPRPQAPVPVVEPDVAFVLSNARAGRAMQPAATFIGHATVLVQMGGLNLLTDPQFSERASPVGFVGPRRAQPPGLALERLPHIDLVLISHNHYDHLDLATVQALTQQPGGPPLFVVPLGLKRWMTEVGVERAVELDWWQSQRLGDVEVVLTPVQHWSARGFGDRMKTLWGGYAVFAPDFHLYFSGDTGYSKDFVDTRQHFAERQTAAQGGGFDLALLAVGGYEPRWFMKDQHVNPAEAVRIHRDLGAKRSLGVHWGTFELTDEPLDEPPRALAEARQAAGLGNDEFIVLPIGGTWKLPKRMAEGASPATARAPSP